MNTIASTLASITADFEAKQKKLDEEKEAATKAALAKANLETEFGNALRSAKSIWDFMDAEIRKRVLGDDVILESVHAIGLRVKGGGSGKTGKKSGKDTVYSDEELEALFNFIKTPRSIDEIETFASSSNATVNKKLRALVAKDNAEKKKDGNKSMWNSVGTYVKNPAK